MTTDEAEYMRPARPHSFCVRERQNSVVQALTIEGDRGARTDIAGLPTTSNLDVRVHHFGCDRVVEVVWRHVHEVEQRGRRAKHLIMGRDIYSPFLDHALRDAMSFGMPEGFVANLHGECRPDMMFRGLSVHLIPWMCGCVALPELKTMAHPNGFGVSLSPWSMATPLNEIVIPGEQVNTTHMPPEGQRVMEGLRAAMVRWLSRPANIIRIKIPGMDVRVG